MNNPAKQADYIPANQAFAVTTYAPLVMKVPGRQVDLELRVSAPVNGAKLPILLLSHGHGHSTFISSWKGYGPLVDFYAAHGFVVIQPTHLDSKALGLAPNGPEGPLFWRTRITDMTFILDHLDQIEKAVPGLAGRLDRNRIVAVGHSAGAHTAAMLAGMRATDPNDGKVAALADKRITAVVLIGAPGGPKDLAPFAAEHFPISKTTDYSQMTTPALIVAGDQDMNPQFSERVSWRADAYPLSPGPKCLYTVFGAKHSYGGIAGYDAAETTDENTEVAGSVERLTWAYLWSAVHKGDKAWIEATAALSGAPKPLGRIDCK